MNLISIKHNKTGPLVFPIKLLAQSPATYCIGYVISNHRGSFPDMDRMQFLIARVANVLNFLKWNGIWKMSRIIDKSENIVAILLDCLSEEKCRRYVIDKLHPSGPTCPHCGAKLPAERHHRFYQELVSSCSRCKKKFFPTSKTPLNSIKITYRELLVFEFLFRLKVRHRDILKMMPRCKWTINYWKNKYLGKL